MMLKRADSAANSAGCRPGDEAEIDFCHGPLVLEGLVGTAGQTFFLSVRRRGGYGDQWASTDCFRAFRASVQMEDD